MIVLIGATGKVGSQTTEHLLKAGKKVRLIARNADQLRPYQERGAEIAVGSATDGRFLAKAFKDADVVLTMIPSDFGVVNIGAHQDQIGTATISAIKSSGVKYVVNLSSVGGHTEVNTGIVAGVARQEVRLNALDHVHILHLRPTYFMENLFSGITMIKTSGIYGSAIRPDVAFPLIATKDIAAVIAKKLMERDFSGKSVLPLLGSRDYTMTEVTSALGQAIGKPELPYVQFSYEDTKASLMQWGASESVADAFVGLSKGINIGVFANEKRNAESNTPTTIEDFATKFAQAYQQ